MPRSGIWSMKNSKLNRNIFFSPGSDKSHQFYYTSLPRAAILFYTLNTESSACDWFSPFTRCLVVDSSKVAKYCFDAFVPDWFLGEDSTQFINETFSSSTYHERLQLSSSGWYLLLNYHATPISSNYFRLLNIRVNFIIHRTVRFSLDGNDNLH